MCLAKLLHCIKHRALSDTDLIPQKGSAAGEITVPRSQNNVHIEEKVDDHKLHIVKGNRKGVYACSQIGAETFLCGILSCKDRLHGNQSPSHTPTRR